MKLKRLLTLITLLLLAAFVLAACGSDEAEVPADEPAAAESSDESAVEETPAEEMTEEEVAEVEEPAEEEEPVEEAAATESDLTLTIWVDEKQFDVIDGMVDELQNEYGATLIVQQFGFGDLQNQFLIAAPAGEGPDVLVTAHNTLGEVVTNGLLAPIDLGDAAADYAPAAIQAWQYNGELYGRHCDQQIRVCRH
jgi:maltose-binding protein MalE